MRCGSCGCENSDQAAYCRKCGAKLQTRQTIYMEEPHGNTLPKWLLGVIIGVLIAAAGFAAFLVFSGQDHGKQADDPGEQTNSSMAGQQEPSASPAQEPEEGIHEYSYVLADCGWEEASELARNAGGYLAHIDSPEEFSYLTEELEDRGYHKMQFYIGGKRNPGEYDYYWVDYRGETYGEPLNTSLQDWLWMEGEPSFEDEGIEETYMNIFYYRGEGRWVANDAPENVIVHVPEFQGRVGYIIEYEN